MIRLRSLGEAVFEVGDSKITPGAPLRFAALLYFVVERGKRISRQSLTEMLWPTVAEAGGRHSLRHMLYMLRGMGVEFADGPHDVELVADRVAVDYETVLREPMTAAHEIGDFLPGYSPSWSQMFAEWLDQLRARVNGRFRTAILCALAEAKAHGQWTNVEQLARRCLRFDPLNEEATLAFAEATALSGGKAAAVAILDRYLKELGATPRELKLPASVLRTRIAERLPAPYSAAADSCFVGREDIMAELTMHLNRARAGIGAGCYVWGSAGIGKSRAVLELMRVAALQGLRPVRVTCQPSDVRRPLSAFVDLVPALQELPGALGCSPTSRQFLERLTQSRPEAPSVADGDRDAEFLYASLRRSLFDLIDAVSEERTLFMIIEDVHWLDRVSADVLRELIERSESRPLLLVLTSRVQPTVESPLFGLVRGLATRQVLPLTQSASERLFLTLLGERAGEIDEAGVRRNTTLAEGNPFFLRELATYWLERGGAGELPSSLTAAIEERLGRLDGPTLRVLQSCALLGKNSTFERLERVSGYGRLDLVDSLETLDRAGLLDSHGAQALAKHDLLAEGAVARLSPTAARFLHRQVGLTLEAELGLDQHGSLLWDCARHLQVAGEVDRAIKVITRCADQLLGVGLAQESVEIWQRALSMCDTDAQRLHSKEHLALSLAAAEQYSAVIQTAAEVQVLRDAVVPGEIIHDDLEVAQWDAEALLGYDMRSLLDRSAACLHDARASLHHRFCAGHRALIQAHNLGDAEAAHSAYRVLDRTLRGARVTPLERTTVDVIYHTSYGDTQLAIDAGRRLVALRPEEDSPAVTRALRIASSPLRYHGIFDEAEALLIDSYTISQRLQLACSARTSAILLAELNLAQRRMPEAKHWLRHAMSSPQQSTYAILINSFQLAGQVAVLEHDAEEARRAVDLLSGLPAQSSLRINCSTWAVDVAMRLMRDGYVEPTLATDFESAFSKLRQTCCQDFSAFVYYQLLIAQGDQPRALRELSRYVNQDRRERSPLPFYLAPIAGSPEEPTPPPPAEYRSPADASAPNSSIRR